MEVGQKVRKGAEDRNGLFKAMAGMDGWMVETMDRILPGCNILLQTLRVLNSHSPNDHFHTALNIKHSCSPLVQKASIFMTT